MIFLTARNTETDMIAGFDAGGDDYVTKPFSMPVLLRRVEALLRRSGEHARSFYYSGSLAWDFENRELSVAGEKVSLTPTEQKLLEVFLKNRNMVLTREVLLARVWDVDENFVDEKTLNVNVQRLRRKLEGDAKLRAWCDRKWTEEAVFNLLDNAVKYAARPGTIKVRAAAFDLYLKIEVEDISAPIEPGEYNRIFQRFYRGKIAAMVQEGVGLGLFLTRQIITGQKGYMEVSRGKQGGNVFSVFLLKGKETAKCSP